MRVLLFLVVPAMCHAMHNNELYYKMKTGHMQFKQAALLMMHQKDNDISLPSDTISDLKSLINAHAQAIIVTLQHGSDAYKKYTKKAIRLHHTYIKDADMILKLYKLYGSDVISSESNDKIRKILHIRASELAIIARNK